MKVTKRISVAAAIGLFAGACSSSSEPTASSSDAIDFICGGEAAKATLDGIPAYQWCANTDVWTNNGIDTHASSGGNGWTQTEGGYGYQCVEYAVRYMYFHWNVSKSWFVGYAKDMCGTHPNDVSVVTNPVHGDLAVFTPGACGADATAGHVAAINTVSSSSISVVQENPAGTYNWNKSCVKCYLHAANNNGSSDPCSSAADGLYCGQSTQWAGGTKDDLYDCEGGVTNSKTVCAGGCIVEPQGQADQCGPDPMDAGSDASMPTEDAAPPTNDAAPPPAQDAGNMPVATSASGCSSSPARAGGNATWIVLLGLIAMTLRKRAR